VTGETRTRTYQWIEPNAPRSGLADRTGLEYYEALRDGAAALAPIAETIGWRVSNVERGLVRLSLKPGDFLFHGGGVMHGGVISTLLDSAMAGALITVMEGRRVCTTQQLAVTMLRAVKREAGEIFAEGRVDHVTAKAGAASATLTDGDGRLYAKAMMTGVVIEGR